MGIENPHIVRRTVYLQIHKLIDITMSHIEGEKCFKKNI